MSILLIKKIKYRIQFTVNNRKVVVFNIGNQILNIAVLRLFVPRSHQTKLLFSAGYCNIQQIRIIGKFGDFIIHCMMDEIGKLHPSNVKGILQFANVRNIYLINSSPMGYNADIYKYNYLLTKDSKSQTHIKRLMTINVG